MPNKERIPVHLSRGEIATIAGLGFITAAGIYGLNQLALNPDYDVCILFGAVIWGAVVANVGIYIKHRMDMRRIQTEDDIRDGIIDGKWRDLP